MSREPSALARYRKKRDFSRTPEPRGEERAAPARPRASAAREHSPSARVHSSSARLLFVVQKHAATRLHYDLRLEMGGVLKSWAVPKGPSLDPEVQSLAVHVEDHPLEYGSFEGVIPEGEYGGGTVLLWDRGEWHPEGDPEASYGKGRLKFGLEGEKLRGRWLLVRMGRADGDRDEARNWLLRKLRDDHARPEEEERVVYTAPRSVASGRTLEEIAADADRVWSPAEGEPGSAPDEAEPRSASAEDEPESPSGGGPPESRSDDATLPAPPAGAPRRDLPEAFSPQLPTLVKEAPRGDDWLHELKFDGIRILARVQDGAVRLITRRGHDWTERFPAVAQALFRPELDGTMLDGELVVLLPDGTTDFQALQNVLSSGRRDRLVLFLFDLPFYRGRDLTDLPLGERKDLLRELLAHWPRSGSVRYSDHIVGQGPGVLENACRHAIEGVVAKRATSPYREGRTRSWVKVKCSNRQELVVGGWTEPAGSRVGLGALLLGWYDEEGRLVYAGRVGTGFTSDSLAELRARLDRIPAARPPFADPPRGSAARGVHWVEPRLVAEVEFGSWTDQGILRHASFQGLREDKRPEEVTREEAREMANGVRRESVAGVRLTNADRVLFPEQGVTKRDLAIYIEAVAGWILPHVADRPLTLVRCPRGRGEKCFYQKHLTEGLPEPIRGIEVDEQDGTKLYVGVDDPAGLVTLVQFGVLELHPWGSRRDRLDRPDRLVFDLDPGEGVAWPEIVGAARRLRDRLADLGLASFVRTTGGKGLHVVCPLTRRSEWSEVKGFAKEVAAGFVREDREHFVATASKAQRKGKIYVDYLRNGRGATAIASYSPRALPGAPVATPVRWDELSRLPGPASHTVSSVPGRLRRLKADPWEGFFDLRQSITKSMRERIRSPRSG